MEDSVAISQLEDKTGSVIERAKVLVVTTDEENAEAADFIRTVIKPMKKELKDTFDPICEKANAAHKEATGARAKHLAPLDEAERTIKGAIGQYALEQQKKAEAEARKVEEEERRVRVAALNKAEKQTSKLLEKAGSVQEQIDVLEGQLTDPTVELSDTDREVIENRLETLRHQKESADEAVADKKEEAEAITYAPTAAPAVSRPKVKGMNVRFKNDPVLMSLELLVKAALDPNSPTPLSVVLPDMKRIQKLVDADIRVPGVRVEKKPITSIR